MFSQMSCHVLNELSNVLKAVDETQVQALIDAIIQAERIVTCGAGRMGMMAKAFAMRLGHLGLTAYHIQDCNTPRINQDDLLLICSGSGETKTILALAEIAKHHNARIALVTARPHSSMASLSDLYVVLPAPSKVDPHTQAASVQPMTTLTEQSSLLFFDTIALLLMQKLAQTPEMLKNRHSVLE